MFARAGSGPLIARVLGKAAGEGAQEAVEEGGDQEAGVAAALGEQARAQATITATQSRSTAVLSLPAGAAVTKGFLYWSGAGIGTAVVLANLLTCFTANIGTFGRTPLDVGFGGPAGMQPRQSSMVYGGSRQNLNVVGR